MSARPNVRVRARHVPLLLAASCSLVLLVGGLIGSFPPARGIGMRSIDPHQSLNNRVVLVHSHTRDKP